MEHPRALWGGRTKEARGRNNTHPCSQELKAGNAHVSFIIPLKHLLGCCATLLQEGFDVVVPTYFSQPDGSPEALTCFMGHLLLPLAEGGCIGLMWGHAKAFMQYNCDLLKYNLSLWVLLWVFVFYFYRDLGRSYTACYLLNTTICISGNHLCFYAGNHCPSVQHLYFHSTSFYQLQHSKGWKAILMPQVIGGGKARAQLPHTPQSTGQTLHTTTELHVSFLWSQYLTGHDYMKSRWLTVNKAAVLVLSDWEARLTPSSSAPGFTWNTSVPSLPGSCPSTKSWQRSKDVCKKSCFSP